MLSVLVIAACSSGARGGVAAVTGSTSTVTDAAATPSSAPAGPAVVTTSSTLQPSTLPARALVVDGRDLIEFNVSTGERGRVLYESPVPIGAVDPIPNRTGVLDAFLAVGTGECEPRIVRLTGSAVADLGISGFRPRVSHDGRRLVYVASRKDPRGVNRCEWTLVVRELATGNERRWLFDDWEGFDGPVWSPDDRSVFVIRGGEGYGPLLAVDTVAATEGPLSSVVTAVQAALRDGEWLGLPIQVNDGVFVRVKCCRRGDGVNSFEPPTGFAIITLNGLRRVDSSLLPVDVEAIDPTGRVAVFSLADGRTYTSRLDGSDRRPIVLGSVAVVFY